MLLNRVRLCHGINDGINEYYFLCPSLTVELGGGGGGTFDFEVS